MNRVDMSHLLKHKEYTQADIETHLFHNTHPAQPTDKQLSDIFDNATKLTLVFVYATQARFDTMVINNKEHLNAYKVVMLNTPLHPNMSVEAGMAECAKIAVDLALHTMNNVSRQPSPGVSRIS